MKKHIITPKKLNQTHLHKNAKEKTHHHRGFLTPSMVVGANLRAAFFYIFEKELINFLVLYIYNYMFIFFY